MQRDQMAEQFSPRDPYEVQAAWETVMTAVEEIRAEQKWPDEYIAKTLKGIAESLEEKACCKDQGRDEKRQRAREHGYIKNGLIALLEQA